MSKFIYLKVPKEKFDNLLDHFCFDQTIMNGECNRHKNCEDCEDFLNNYEIKPPVAEIATTEKEEFKTLKSFVKSFKQIGTSGIK